MYDLVIFIAGPEMHHCFDEDLAFLKYFAKEIKCIGDGRQSIFNLQNKMLKDEIDQITNKDLPEKILVYVSAHGAELDSEHFILTDTTQFGRKTSHDSIFFYSKDLFKLLAQTIKKPFDIIFFPCASRHALKDVVYLPKGSKAVIIEGYSVPHAARDAIIKRNVKPEAFNLDFYYDNLLANLGYYNDPILIEAGGGIIDPVSSSSNYLGKSISSEEKLFIQKSFSHNICDNHTYFERIDNVISKFASAKDLSDFKERDSKLINDFFYAWIWIELNCPYLENKDDMRNAILKFKPIADQYLALQKLPFKLDINSDFWPTKISEKRSHLSSNKGENLEKRIPEFSRRYSIRACIDLAKTIGLSIKSDFVIPDYPEYGLVLGIVKYLEVYAKLAESIAEDMQKS